MWRRAGVDFKNQYYPEFLNQKLKFGMIRYGPAGITAADYDNDGFYDLFIPDGVESKLFRNLGNGKFEDVTAKAGLAGLDGVSVALFADYDNDGYKDLFVSRTFKPNQLVPQQRRRHVHRCDEEIRYRRGLLHHRRVVGRLRQRRLPRPVRGPLSRSAEGHSDDVLRAQRRCRISSITTTRRHFHQRDGKGRRRRSRACASARCWGDYNDDGYPGSLRRQRFRPQDAVSQQRQRNVHGRHGRSRERWPMAPA